MTGVRSRFGVVGAVVALVLWLVCAVGVAYGAEGFGVSSFGTTLSSSQAGAHADFTTQIAFNTEAGSGDVAGQVKDIHVNLPVGLVGDPQTIPRCTPVELSTYACKPVAQVGVLNTTLVIPSLTPGEPGEVVENPSAVYNMAPSPGHVATLAAQVAFATILIQVDLRTDGSYGLQASIDDIPTLVPIQSTSLTLWGVPGDPGHDALRIGPAPEYSVPTGVPGPYAPFMISPSDCSDGPIPASLSVDSWQNPGVLLTSTAALATPTGCDQLQAAPAISVTPESTQASSPSGYAVDLHVPQDLEPYALATPDLREAVVRLPVGVAVSPSAANGLGACSEEQIGLGTGSVPSCPDASKLGTVEVDTPLLGVPLVGSVYLAQQGSNPFGSLLALYVVAEGGGAQVKLAGMVSPDPVTGQLTASFKNTPQVPFTDFKLTFFGGPGASLSNPAVCGQATTTSQLTFYNSTTPAEPSSAFNVTGCTGGGFSPAFSAGTTSNQAAGFSPLSVTFSRSDQEQGLGSVTVQTPPGLLGVLKTVPLCGEPQAAQGTCGQESLIGHTTVDAGPGSSPFHLGGNVYLTGPYKGAPFGLSIVVPAIAGPINLGTVVVRATINVDRHTSALTVTSDPLPSILQGIPLQIRTVNVTVDRAGFIFNPTDCEPLSVAGTIASTQGTQATVSSPFQAANCASLGFHPVFAVSSPAKTSRASGAALDVKVVYPSGSQANIHSVAVSLPVQLPARLSTIQQACPEGVFNQDPASCDAGSLVGVGTAVTPILSTPLVGPAYLVSHGGAAFPDIVVVLQGQGITLDLVGNVNIAKSGVTSATFAHVPDAPIGSFDLNLPEGPHSALSAVGSLCSKALSMPTTITGQNGAQVKQNTQIQVTGCTKAKTKKKKPKKHKKHKKKGKKASNGSAGHGGRRG